MARHLINPNQTQATRIYQNQFNQSVIVDKDGIFFSDDKEMDAVVEFFKNELGFIQVKKEKEMTEKEAKKLAKELAQNGGNE